MTSKLIRAAINRSRTTLLVMAVIIIAGLSARLSIPVESQPHVEVPMFLVDVYHEGISPEDAERLLVMPLETELRSVEGIDEVTGFASEGSGTVLVEFVADYDLDEALLDVREAVDRAKPEFPTTAEEPYVREIVADDMPIIQVSLIGSDVAERTIYNLVREIRDDIEAIPDVLEGRLQGDREELLEIVIDPTRLDVYEISNEELISTIVRNNRLVPAGSLDTGEGRMSIKVPSVIESASDIFDIPVRSTLDSVITLADVASVRRTFKDRVRYAHVDGNPSMTIDVLKRTNASIIDTVQQVKAVTETYRSRLPANVRMLYTNDQAPSAQTQVTELQGNIVTALFLVMIVVVAAMGFRSGIIVGASIPVAFLFALIFIHQLGYTFNFMVMFGMLLGLGMLIDGAIVVTEYADRKLVEGFDRRDAYTLAVDRMFWPVTASVATTLAAFLPLIFWPGVAGKFMRYLPVTVFAVLSGSLLYALVFGPTIGSLVGRASRKNQRAVEDLKQLESGDPTQLAGVTGAYARLLALASRYAVVTMAITILTLITSFGLFYVRGTGMTFFTENDPTFAHINVRARGNLAADEVYQIVREVEQTILDIPGILEVNMNTGTGGVGNGWTGGGGAQDSVGSLYLQFHEQRDRELRGAEIIDRIRQQTAQIPGIVVEVQELEMGPPVGKDVQIQFSSNHRGILEPVVTRVREYLDAEVSGLRDIADTRSLPGIEWTLIVDKAQAALYGADVTLVGIAVQLVTNGLKVGEYRPDGADEAVDIRVRYPDGERGFRALDELTLATQNGRVPISNFVTRAAVPKVDTIQRIDGKIVEYIRANVMPGVLADNKVDEIQAWLDAQTFDSRVSIDFRGANEEQNQSMDFIIKAMIMSVLLMFVLLVTQFNSFYQASLILFAVVMSTAGVLLGLAVTGTPFSAILTGIGVIALAGIVVNNNIVLIDTYNRMRLEEPDLDYISLIVRTGAHRLRPVSLTAVTTVLGLLPLASNWSIDFVNRTAYYGSSVSGFWVPLAQAIVFGLSFATLLTLVSTPAMLALPHQLRTMSTSLLKKTPPRGIRAESQ